MVSELVLVYGCLWMNQFSIKNHRQSIKLQKAQKLYPLSSSGLDNSFLQFTVAKLNRRNYRKWAQSVKLIINGKGKLGYQAGETEKPNSTNFVAL